MQHYVVAKKNTIEIFKDEQLINRVQLAKILGVSRQTLTAWIQKEFITPMKSKYFPNVETFNTDNGMYLHNGINEFLEIIL